MILELDYPVNVVLVMTWELLCSKHLKKQNHLKQFAQNSHFSFVPQGMFHFKLGPNAWMSYKNFNFRLKKISIFIVPFLDWFTLSKRSIVVVFHFRCRILNGKKKFLDILGLKKVFFLIMWGLEFGFWHFMERS